MAAPEIAIRQAGTDLPDGISTFAFPAVALYDSSDPVTFTIDNTGPDPLTLIGNPKVGVSGSNPTMFTVISQPPTSIPTSATFAIRFYPTVLGPCSAVVTVANNDSDESVYTFVVTGTATAQPVAEAPMFSPPGDVYPNPQNVTISSPTPMVTIFYTLDGAVPAHDLNGMPLNTTQTYRAPILVDARTRIRAVTFRTLYAEANFAEADYDFQAGTPTFGPGPGESAAPVSVSISTVTTGATIFYTIDGSPPLYDLVTNNPIPPTRRYVAPISVAVTETIRAIAAKRGIPDSEVRVGTYTLRPPAPVIQPAARTSNAPFVATLTDSDPAAIIYYTIDGSTPTTDSSTTPSGTVRINRSLTLSAIASRPGWTPSDAVIVHYAVKPDAPSISPASGTFSSMPTVTISPPASATDAKLRYTSGQFLDSAIVTPPSLAYGKDYSAPLQLAPMVFVTVKAIAYFEGGPVSEVATASYTIRMPHFIAFNDGTRNTVLSPGNNRGLVASSTFPFVPYHAATLGQASDGRRRALAVGPFGKLAYTDDGITWTESAAGTANLNGAAFVSGRWLVVGDGGTIRYSDDGGIHWAAAASGTTRNLNGVLAARLANGQFRLVVTGDAGTLLVSSDRGATWQAITTPSQKNHFRLAQADSFAGTAATGRIIAAGGDVIYSDDGGTTWQIAATGTSIGLHGIAFQKATAALPKGRWVAVGMEGEVRASVDNGLTWQRMAFGGNYYLFGVTYHDFAPSAPGYWVVAGRNGTLRYSSDLVTWRDAGIPDLKDYWDVIFWE